ncbi:MAG: UDP-N-acetylmuramate dehydrogenase [Rhodoglobus sp.]
MLLAELTTLRVGGPAACLIEATTREQLIAASREAWDSGEDLLLLGGGSNVVIADTGFEGTVIQVASRGIHRSQDHPARLVVQAGEPWDAVVDFAVANGLAGIEALSGIPGSSGAAPIQNIGAYGQEIGATLASIQFLDQATGEVEQVSVDELALGYRTSVLKRGRQGVVVSIELELAASTEGSVAYPQLAQALGVSVGASLPLSQVRSSVLALRAAKGMVLDPTDPDSVSCGSFFTNPIVSENFSRSLPQDAPRWPLTPDEPDLVVPLGQQLPESQQVQQLPAHHPPQQRLVKLSAAWLIEHSGIGRGFALPGSSAAISSKHSLAITNRGGATAEQVAELSRFIHARVLSEFGVGLQPEPVSVGLQLS